MFTYPHSSFTLFCPALSEIKNEKLFIHIPTTSLNSPFFGVIRLYSLTLFFSFFFSDYIGTSKNAFTDGRYFSVTACIFAMALGVAPIPKPHVPAAKTAAS